MVGLTLRGVDIPDGKAVRDICRQALHKAAYRASRAGHSGKAAPSGAPRRRTVVPAAPGYGDKPAGHWRGGSVRASRSDTHFLTETADTALSQLVCPCVRRLSR